MTEQREELTGVIDRFLFHNDENGFSVFILKPHRGDTVTVCGFFSSVNPGENVTVRGTWTYHQKFGKQFSAQSYDVTLPQTVEGIKKYLGSGLIKGIGPTYAEKLVNFFGEQVLEIIDQDPQQLRRVPGIGAKRVELIAAAWQDQKEISNVMIFLRSHGVSAAYAAKIYKHYGTASVSVLTENPYRLADDIWGIGFKTADQIAQNLGMGHASVKRVQAGIVFAITQHSSSGHLAIALNDLKEQAYELLGLTAEEHAAEMKSALHALHAADRIKLITHEQVHYITLSSLYGTEKSVARKIKTLMQEPSLYSFNLDEVYAQLRAGALGPVALNDDQQRGIMTCLQSKITIITGGPGTGKTTLIKALLTTLEQHKLRYRLAAPTGRAAKRITEGTGRPAVTLHRLLEFDFTTMGFAHNENNALQLDFLIVDEASMIDIFLAHAILRALPYTAHLVFIGDIDQLPSVGPGNVLRDMIESGTVACVRLEHIFRQAQDSMIVVNAHRVNQGQMPTAAHEGSKRDFFFIKDKEPEKVVGYLQKIVSTTLKQYRIALQDAIVLTPMNRGAVGTQKLNYDLQNLLNPGATEKKAMRAGIEYKIDDRVMQIRNNYDKNVFNGDIGTIIDVNPFDKNLQVNFEGLVVEYQFDELDELTLAYAVSIHKSQGSEYGAVIIPLFMSHFMLLQRNLVYTAITRAKRLCIIIGDPKALAIAVRNATGTERTTFLKEFLTTDLACWEGTR